VEVSRGSGRVNMDALARILGGEGDFDSKVISECDSDADSERSEPVTSRNVGSDHHHHAEELSAWRPLSPGMTAYDSMDRYEEEY